MIDIGHKQAIDLLRRMIRIPSFSREEGEVCSMLEEFMRDNGISLKRKGNNLWMFNRCYDASKPTILLNSHIDTVKPNAGQTRDPFSPDVEGERLYGLGSNDAGASVVSLLAAFAAYYETEGMKYNLCLALTAQEECSGEGGIESLLPELGDIEFAIVGEPTGMNPAVAEKGLMVLDCKSVGVAGHAARGEGVNAIYAALPDIEWFANYKFPSVSDFLGEVMMSVTVINAGTQHNVIPAECNFTVDVRLTDRYSHEEVLGTIRNNVTCGVTPRSMRLRPSFISTDHPAVAAAVAEGGKPFGSPTSSDQTLIPFTSLKIGPGESSRSHSADEYVLVREIEKGIDTYKKILGRLLFGQ